MHLLLFYGANPVPILLRKLFKTAVKCVLDLLGLKTSKLSYFKIYSTLTPWKQLITEHNKPTNCLFLAQHALTQFCSNWVASTESVCAKNKQNFITISDQLVMLLCEGVLREFGERVDVENGKKKLKIKKEGWVSRVGSDKNRKKRIETEKSRIL